MIDEAKTSGQLHHRLLSVWVTCVWATVLTSCAAMNEYVDAKRYQASGGDARDIAAAEQRLVGERSQRQTLQVTAAQRQRELDDARRELSSLERTLADQKRRLDAARKARRISAARHAEFRRESAALERDVAALRARQAKRVDASGASDASDDSADRQKLEQLRRRKDELERALAAASAR